jgi:hypothetical protein
MNLEEKLKRIAEGHYQKVDWESVKQEWISRVHGLYDEIREWLKPLEDKEYLKIERNPLVITEEMLGPYEIDSMEIIAGETTVVLEPVGRQVLGAMGRVDLFPRGYRIDGLMLLYVEYLDSRPHWEVRQSNLSGLRKDLTKEVFEQILNGWF